MPYNAAMRMWLPLLLLLCCGCTQKPHHEGPELPEVRELEGAVIAILDARNVPPDQRPSERKLRYEVGLLANHVHDAQRTADALRRGAVSREELTWLTLNKLEQFRQRRPVSLPDDHLLRYLLNPDNELSTAQLLLQIGLTTQLVIEERLTATPEERLFLGLDQPRRPDEPLAVPGPGR